jgi:threonine/homoserine/homoserine lactone efflux protein
MALIEGFIFGMLLQLTIGPVFLYVINIAITNGFMAAFVSTAGVTLADAVYITLALAGITGLAKNEKMQIYFKLAGGIVLVLFGLYIIFDVLSHGLLTGASVPHRIDSGAGFLFAFLLTLSNPLTIIFWSGIFALKISEKKMNKGNLYLFGLGAVLSTLVFLSAAAGLGSVFHAYLPGPAVNILNLAAGIAILVFGVCFFRRKITAS